MAVRLQIIDKEWLLIMKRLLIFPVIVAFVIACSACLRSEISDLPIDGGCTVVYATDGERALGGNNEDTPDNPFMRIWFLPGEDSDSGRVYVGAHVFFAQGGMNEMGLFFDGMGGPRVHVPQGDKESVGAPLVDRIMRECGTVDCVIEYFDTYHLVDTWSHQFLFGDAFGNSVIIEPLNVIRMEGNYQVGTNFYQSKSDPVWHGCPRYRKATEMLRTATDVSVKFIRDVMHAVSNDYTMYTTVYDLKQQVVYLYHFHDYENVVVFNLSEELAQGVHAYDIASLFPEKSTFENYSTRHSESYERLIESNIDSDISPTIYDAYVGTYLGDWIHGTERMSVIAEGNSLWLIGPLAQHELFPKSETYFFTIGQDLRLGWVINFSVGEDGKATQMEVRDGDEILILERQSDDILRDLLPILQVETPISKVAKDEDAAPVPLWIALIAGGVILLGGGGLFFVWRSKEQ
jgi:hypothetical protein